MSCYPISHLDMFEFVIFDEIIIHIMFGLENVVKYFYIDTTHDTKTQIATLDTIPPAPQNYFHRFRVRFEVKCFVFRDQSF